jgi:molybdenum cofactor cytidylyltransferase
VTQDRDPTQRERLRPGAAGRISAIVLAAGTSTRFGSPKQLARVRGRTLVQHAVDAATGAGLDEVIVVLGHEADAVRASLSLPRGARIVQNPRPAEGQSSSLAIGLGSCDPSSEAAIVLLGDQPGIRSEHVRALTSAFAEGPRDAVRLRFHDGPGPALLARSIWAEVMELSGDVGARALLDARPERVRWVDIDEDAPRDVNAPEDLERA